MATFTANPSVDGYVQRAVSYSGRGAETWDEVTTNSTGTLANTSSVYLYTAATKQTSTSRWLCNRGLMSFDLSSMPADAVISAAKITVYVNTYFAQTTNGNQVMAFLWTGGSSISTADYNDFDASYTTNYESDISSTGADQDFTIDNTLLGWLQDNPQGNGSNLFNIMFRNRLDVNSADLSESDPTGFNAQLYRSQEYSTSSHRPVLTITYSTGYGNSVVDVASGNISSINGIAAANISKVNDA